MSRVELAGTPSGGTKVYFEKTFYGFSEYRAECTNTIGTNFVLV